MILAVSIIGEMAKTFLLALHGMEKLGFMMIALLNKKEAKGILCLNIRKV